MDASTRQELTDLATDYAIDGFNMIDDEAEAYSTATVRTYSACLDGTIGDHTEYFGFAVHECLTALGELGYDTSNRPFVHATILAQLGGVGRLCAMAGVPRSGGIITDDMSVTIRFRGCRKFDRVKITLDSDDTYTAHFMKLNTRTWELTREDKTSTLAASQLVSIFENKTGLALSL